MTQDEQSGSPEDAPSLRETLKAMMTQPFGALGGEDCQWVVQVLRLYPSDEEINLAGMRLLIRLTSEFPGSETLLIKVGARPLAVEVGKQSSGELLFLAEKVDSLLPVVGTDRDRGSNALNAARGDRQSGTYCCGMW
eukprot:TRINITY_DN26366_c0_g1_i1.p1 TRINITY_DN26366_c0_g1~~TRINITY_DN26366_c0_g1_i1.p1  ORF type:complete len:137 (+),score=19.38 TRINITY_DN26366_c0_g1_i1:3-413(+)